MNAVVTGVGVALPGVRTLGDLLTPPYGPADPVEPGDRIGRKGLRYKDRATQLGFVAADQALHGSGLLVAGSLTVPAGLVAVVASSNFGNLDTICDSVDTIAEETAAGVSPMLLPNASSNVVASSVAIRFGLRGPNLMVCNGDTSGLDAVHWAVTMIAGGRAEQVLVVGVEPDTEPARRLAGADRIVDGAVALVVETPQGAAKRGVAPLAKVGGYQRTAGVATCLSRLGGEDGHRPAVWHTPGALPDDLLRGVPRLDLSTRWGVTSGTLGVLQCAAAVGWFSSGGDGPVYAVVGDDTCDGTAGLVLFPPGVAA
jgi:3-oxoacyl-[acyl-carrier-protein] synthase II